MGNGSKYGNRRIKADGYTFDSKAEYARWRELCLLEAAGEIGKLRVHPRYELQPAFTDATGKKHRAIFYEGDFEYEDRSGIPWPVVVEDVKGAETQAFKLKRKLFLFKYRNLRLDVVQA